ncbi:hypothetical protein A2819_00320 [Candidatus Azambacteria bacterium RIFCSPHIGHO2_01_FULL_40_24]|uniref:Glycosyltransferase RgtA/B/C/D-like domain-containing protein n=1 Tax=Candidatus Azambacteria bacterium RIFCSPHIGHO2_01_FULL_40_24 TaxID=1797301 RepID=A0A1F5B3W7_9BACT|nr:MAG: hypothetical protein A2819_00320 [Candidatus Azambacteria bacterium RIFCSPHIGHO2_01_FULL_40_24]
MNDLTKKTFIWGIAVLVVLRFLMVILLINDIPFTDMRDNGFRPNFGGSYFPDEVHYFELADSFAKFSPVANVANIGYPLFLAPIIYFTGAVGPEDIAKIVFIIQAFLFFGLAIILVALIAKEIFKNGKLALLAALIFTLYPYLLFGVLKLANFARIIPAFHYQMWINIGADYLSAVLLYFGFYLFIKKYNSGGLNLFFASAIGAVIAAAALTRVANILYLPLIFLILTLLKKYRESIGFGLAAFIVYFPQWVYNFYFFGSPFTYGYRIQELSGHGFETKILGGWFSFNNVVIFFERIWLNLPALIWILPILVIILIFGFLKMFKQEKTLALILGFWTLLNIGFYIFFVDAQSQLRYFIPSILPLIILFIIGIIKLYEFRRYI